MLREVANTRQHSGEPRRRWFFSNDQDLYIWENELGEIVSFQLCYQHNRAEYALHWKEHAGYSHMRVDKGETSVLANRSPILSVAGEFDADFILYRFLASAGALSRDIVDFVAQRIKDYSRAENGPVR